MAASSSSYLLKATTIAPSLSTPNRLSPPSRRNAANSSIWMNPTFPLPGGHFASNVYLATTHPHFLLRPCHQLPVNRSAYQSTLSSPNIPTTKPRTNSAGSGAVWWEKLGFNLHESSTALLDAFCRAIQAMKIPAVTAVVLLLVLSNPLPSRAATGGAMGGDSFDSGSSYDSSYDSGSSSWDSYSDTNSSSNKPSKPMSEAMNCMQAFFVFLVIAAFLTLARDSLKEQTALIKIQIGCVGVAKSLQNDLNKIAKIADTSDRKGFHFILTETTKALLENFDNCYSAHSLCFGYYESEEIDEFYSENDEYYSAKDKFKKFSQEERAKFDELTLLNVNNTKKHIMHPTLRSKGVDKGYIVVTILLVANTKPDLPVINGKQDLKDVLEKLCSLAFHQIEAIEVLWTPQNKNDFLSQEELIKNYPQLRPLSSEEK